MYIEYTEEQKALRQKMRSYFTALMTEEQLEALKGQGEAGPEYRKVIKQMGTDGWLALGFPEEYGGQGKGAVEQLMFFEEALLAGAPIPFVTINTVAPALMAYGTEEQKKKFLGGIAAGEIHFAIGYTEPNAGTDLAVLGTTAEKDADDIWTINGTKVFTSSAEEADYIWLACRTTPDVKHKGVTMFIMDAKDPGYTFAPIHTVGGMRTNMTYYSNVKVPDAMRVGAVDKGWGLIMAQLNHERLGLAAWGIHGWNMFQETLKWARTTQPSGLRPIDEAYVQTNLAEVYTMLEAQRVMNQRIAWELDQDRLHPALASGAKVFSTEGVIEVTRLLMECVGPETLLNGDSAGAFIRGRLESEYRRSQINTFGGGVNEIQRGVIANFGLMMPRHR